MDIYAQPKFFVFINTLTIAKNLILSDKLLLIQYTMRNVRGVGTLKSKAKTLSIKFSIRNTCFFEYVSSVINTNSPTSGA